MGQLGARKKNKNKKNFRNRGRFVISLAENRARRKNIIRANPRGQLQPASQQLFRNVTRDDHPLAFADIASTRNGRAVMVGPNLGPRFVSSTRRSRPSLCVWALLVDRMSFFS